ncbi:hypothetical protein ColLi_09544 [Colletotrichum liriopes]|uniref:Uncharacterized protein n=1 Tax=Colletotrichum liriopes TaxID=708192 RepID=A0AA37GUN3_9PEZI|nr:hypothetical protein ColLi_09544 [Colletotrichum liriopes]
MAPLGEQNDAQLKLSAFQPWAWNRANSLGQLGRVPRRLGAPSRTCLRQNKASGSERMPAEQIAAAQAEVDMVRVLVVDRGSLACRLLAPGGDDARARYPAAFGGIVLTASSGLVTGHMLARLSPSSVTSAG